MLDIPNPLPLPQNEPVLSYAPGTPERVALKAALEKMWNECPDIPHVIGGEKIHEGTPFDVRAPHAHAKVLAHVHAGGGKIAERAIEAAMKAAPMWAATPFDERARIFQRAADLLAGPWRQILNASTMLGQSKTAFQAEIDSACELIDFLRFNVAFASRLAEQPLSPPGVHNALELRPLEGFVFAITPFNFTAIGGNLPTSPAIMGNTVVWKPASTQSLSAHYFAELLEAAGLPPGVINVVYGEGGPIGDVVLQSPHLAGIHFTGSTRLFHDLWRRVGENIARYKVYPRLVGETGGKDFVFAHPSADLQALSTALVRGAYEYQGQKCSAASRAYVPKSMWPHLRELLVSQIAEIKIGDVMDFRNFMGAVISHKSWADLFAWLERLRKDEAVKVLADRGWSKETGYFAGPTLVEVSDPKHPVMQTELFGPILAVYPYDDAKIEETLRLVDETSPYALTGSIFARDRAAIARAATVLRQAAGNLYINDKPTGAVVAQQPFGGARASGTNDKAGSAYNLLRWASPRVVKETFVPPASWRYPFMNEA
jgi:1-pyrroline-5-carboxylate dehydrogenase